MSALCPVYLKQQTFPDPVGTSHLCQNQTSALVTQRQKLQLSRSESRKKALEINLKAFGAMGYADRSWWGIQNIRQWEDAHDCDRERRAAG
jgi:hypothetical protein